MFEENRQIHGYNSIQGSRVMMPRKTRHRCVNFGIRFRVCTGVGENIRYISVMQAVYLPDMSRRPARAWTTPEGSSLPEP
jgi:hypothetical protein